MANVEVTSALEKTGNLVELWPATDVVELRSIPVDEAALFWANGWRRVYFRATFDQETETVRSRLTIGQPLTSIIPTQAYELLPEEVRYQARNRTQRRIEGRKNNDGYCPLPSLLVIIDSQSDMRIIAATGGVSGFDYWSSDPSKTKGNELIPDPESIFPLPARTALEGLHNVLANAAGELLAPAATFTSSGV